MEYGFDRLVHYPETLLFFLLQSVFVSEEADFVSSQEIGCMSELQNNYAQHQICKHLCTHLQVKGIKNFHAVLCLKKASSNTS